MIRQRTRRAAARAHSGFRAVIVGLLAAGSVACSSGEAHKELATPQSSGLPYYADESFAPHWFTSRAHVPADFHAIPDFALQDQRGATITSEALEEKIYIANFFFTSCPGICPTTMSNMARLQAEFADAENVVLLSHSVTPEADSATVLEAYARKMDALSSKWYLLTGDRDDVYDLGKHAYFANEDLGEAPMGDDAFLHTESFFLVDQDRRIRGVYNGMNASAVQQLMADVRTLRAEKRATAPRT